MGWVLKNEGGSEFQAKEKEVHIKGTARARAQSRGTAKPEGLRPCKERAGTRKTTQENLDSMVQLMRNWELLSRKCIG